MLARARAPRGTAAHLAHVQARGRHSLCTPSRCRAGGAISEPPAPLLQVLTNFMVEEGNQIFLQLRYTEDALESGSEWVEDYESRLDHATEDRYRRAAMARAHMRSQCGSLASAGL